MRGGRAGCKCWPCCAAGCGGGGGAPYPAAWAYAQSSCARGAVRCEVYQTKWQGVGGTVGTNNGQAHRTLHSPKYVRSQRGACHSHHSFAVQVESLHDGAALVPVLDLEAQCWELPGPNRRHSPDRGGAVHRCIVLILFILLRWCGLLCGAWCAAPSRCVGGRRRCWAPSIHIEQCGANIILQQRELVDGKAFESRHALFRAAAHQALQDRCKAGHAVQGKAMRCE